MIKKNEGIEFFIILETKIIKELAKRAIQSKEDKKHYAELIYSLWLSIEKINKTDVIDYIYNRFINILELNQNDINQYRETGYLDPELIYNPEGNKGEMAKEE